MNTTFTFLGHGTHLIETQGFKILVDPYLDDNPAAPVKAADVEADYIFVSHGHGDHIADAVPVAKRLGIKIITNADLCRWLGKQDVETHAQHVGGGYHHPFGYLKMTNALHGSGLPDGSYGGNPAGMLLTTKDNKNLYLACDTGLFSDMQLIGEVGLDLAVLPIGDNYTMGPEDALQAVKYLKPKHVIPCHYNTWPVIAQDAEAWAARVKAESSSQVHILQPGESFTV